MRFDDGGHAHSRRAAFLPSPFYTKLSGAYGRDLLISSLDYVFKQKNETLRKGADKVRAKIAAVIFAIIRDFGKNASSGT